jgi:alpha-methylacyl-CoA racemase
MVALRHAERTGVGQVVDAAMVDAAALLAAMHHTIDWVDERGSNSVDGGWPEYAIYETADGRHVSVGALEDQFYAELVARMGISDEVPDRADKSTWEARRALFAETFRSRSRAEWCEVMVGSEACFAPVLSMAEARVEPANVERKVFVEYEGRIQPGPAPRLSATPPRLVPRPPIGAVELLTEWGVAPDAARGYAEAGVIR